MKFAIFCYISQSYTGLIGAVWRTMKAGKVTYESVSSKPIQLR